MRVAATRETSPNYKMLDRVRRETQASTRNPGVTGTPRRDVRRVRRQRVYRRDPKQSCGGLPKANERAQRWFGLRRLGLALRWVLLRRVVPMHQESSVWRPIWVALDVWLLTLSSLAGLTQYAFARSAQSFLLVFSKHVVARQGQKNAHELNAQNHYRNTVGKKNLKDKHMNNILKKLDYFRPSENGRRSASSFLDLLILVTSLVSCWVSSRQVTSILKHSGRAPRVMRRKTRLSVWQLLSQVLSSKTKSSMLSDIQTRSSWPPSSDNHWKLPCCSFLFLCHEGELQLIFLGREEGWVSAGPCDRFSCTSSLIRSLLVDAGYPARKAELTPKLINYFWKTTIEALNCQLNSPSEDN